MSEELKLEGKCLCGAVSVAAETEKPRVSACHCAMCRRWSSGPFMAINGRNVVFGGANNISRIRTSDWAERGFCSRCGSNLFYHLVDQDDYQIAAGLFGDSSKLRLSLEVFIDEKPDFYAFDGDHRKMTAEEVIAAFAPPPE